MSVLAFLLISMILMWAFIYSIVQFGNLKEVEVVVSNKEEEKKLK